MKSYPYKSKSATLAVFLSDGYFVYGDCYGCGRRAEPDMAELSTRYGKDTLVNDVIERLTCKECGTKLDMRIGAPTFASNARRKGRSDISLAAISLQTKS